MKISDKEKFGRMVFDHYCFYHCSKAISLISSLKEEGYYNPDNIVIDGFDPEYLEQCAYQDKSGWSIYIREAPLCPTSLKGTVIPKFLNGMIKHYPNATVVTNDGITKIIVITSNTPIGD